MANDIAEKAYEKHAWILLAAIGLFGLIASLPLLFGVDPGPARIEGITGMTMSELRDANPKFLDLVAFSVRTYGLVNLFWSILIIAISVTAYRRGERWAWYALWSLPVFYTISSAILFNIGATVLELVLLPVLLVVSLLGLILPSKKFFQET